MVGIKNISVGIEFEFGKRFDWRSNFKINQAKVIVIVISS